MSIIDLMSHDLQYEHSQLDDICQNAELHYSSFDLHGRPIEAPDEELKLVQTWIYDFVRSETEPLPSFITAYEPGTNIVKNAQIHQSGSHLLTLDVKGFFHSWHTRSLRDYFTQLANAKPSLRISNHDVEMLAKLCTVDNHLPMGSPCSPALANRLMLPCDRQILSSLDSALSYSRYSDDMAFSSTEQIDVEKIIEIVEAILKEYGLRLNRKKIKCRGKGSRRCVTGVFISPDGQLSIGSARRHQLKELVYKHLVSKDGREEVSADKLIGLITFCQQIEPDFVAHVISKYSNYGRAASVAGGLMELLIQESAAERELRQREESIRRRQIKEHMVTLSYDEDDYDQLELPFN